jgi:hypothetical protein
MPPPDINLVCTEPPIICANSPTLSRWATHTRKALLKTLLKHTPSVSAQIVPLNCSIETNISQLHFQRPLKHYGQAGWRPSKVLRQWWALSSVYGPNGRLTPFHTVRTPRWYRGRTPCLLQGRNQLRGNARILPVQWSRLDSNNRAKVHPQPDIPLVNPQPRRHRDILRAHGRVFHFPISGCQERPSRQQ